MESTDCREGSVLTEYSQLVLAKFCTEPIRDWVWCSYRFFLVLDTVPFQFELGKGFFSVDGTNFGPSPWHRNCRGESRCFHLALPRDNIWAVFNEAPARSTPGSRVEVPGFALPWWLYQLVLFLILPLPKSLLVALGPQAEVTVLINLQRCALLIEISSVGL